MEARLVGSLTPWAPFWLGGERARALPYGVSGTWLKPHPHGEDMLFPTPRQRKSPGEKLSVLYVYRARGPQGT